MTRHKTDRLAEFNIRVPDHVSDADLKHSMDDPRFKIPAKFNCSY